MSPESPPGPVECGALALSPAPAAEARSISWIPAATLGLGAALWLVLINQLRLDWETNPQYSYGWLVPLLTAYLVWVRWPGRPAAEPPTQRRWLAAAALLLLLAFLPTRLIGESAPEWSAARWSLAAEVLGLTLAAVVWCAGWPTARYFAWPICFFFVAVAWPVRFETALTQDLMQRLAVITAELLHWAGVSAEPEGNLIRLGAGVVGVDEACSGVRSLQSMLMASLFMGDLYRFTFLGRMGVLALGLGLALFFNIIRALILVSVAVGEGIPALEKWHDSAGFSILFISFAALYLIVRVLHRPAVPAPAAPPQAWRSLPPAVFAAVAAWFVSAELLTEGWYRFHEVDVARVAGWSVRWPEEQAGFKNLPIAAAVGKVLACNEGRQAAWQAGDGEQWQMFAFQWYPGRTSTLAARLHKPEVCLPAGGRRLVEELPPTVVTAGSLRLPFRTYHFDNQGRPLYVFFCLWEVGSRDTEAQGFAQGYSRSSRLQRVLMGQRNLGQQSVEIVLSGPDSAPAAIAAFREEAARLLVAK